MRSVSQLFCFMAGDFTEIVALDGADHTMIIETFSEKETRAFGEKLGREAAPGSIYTLTGELGVGKTVFTQGLARGLGIEEPVNSPTAVFLSIISMYIASETLRKWKRSVTRIIFMGKGSA